MNASRDELLEAARSGGSRPIEEALAGGPEDGPALFWTVWSALARGSGPDTPAEDVLDALGWRQCSGHRPESLLAVRRAVATAKGTAVPAAPNAGPSNARWTSAAPEPIQSDGWALDACFRVLCFLASCSWCGDCPSGYAHAMSAGVAVQRYGPRAA